FSCLSDERREDAQLPGITLSVIKHPRPICSLHEDVRIPCRRLKHRLLHRHRMSRTLNTLVGLSQERIGGALRYLGVADRRQRRMLFSKIARIWGSTSCQSL